MSNEKPTVEVGSRWRVDACGCELVAIDGPLLAKARPCERVHCKRLGGTHVRLPEDMIGVGLTYLGPSPGKESPGMEADEHCPTCYDHASREAHWECSHDGMSGWIRCSHDGKSSCGNYPNVRYVFPRQPALPAPAVPPAKAPGMWTCIRCGGRHPAVEKLCPTRKPKYGRLIGEARAPDGTPLSALQAVACVRSSEDLKKSPPWVPSVDEDHWIPDAPRGVR